MFRLIKYRKKAIASKNIEYVPKGSGPIDPKEYEYVYHGSYTRVPKVDLSQSMHGKDKDEDEKEKTPSKRVKVVKKYKDFSSGHYTTNDLAMAKTFAERVTAERKPNQSIAYVTKYRFELEDASESTEIKVLVFTRPCVEWFDFMVEQRDLNHDHGYDIVIGPTADDKVGKELKRYVERTAAGLYVDKERIIRTLEPEKLGIQILFHTEESKQYLKYIPESIFLSVRK